MNTKTILLYGRTGSGKTTQIGLLAEHIYKTEGKKTRLYTGDRGGSSKLNPIQPYIDLGIIDKIEMGESDPWIFLHRAVRGNIRDEHGKWLDPKDNDVGLWAFEGLRSFAECLMTDMVKKAGQGVDIGGKPNADFMVTDGDDRLKVTGDTLTMYKLAQLRITEEVWESQRLAGSYLLWTSSVSKDDEQTSGGKVLGPDIIGKALTGETPRWFNLTFRIDGLPSQGGKPGRHILYLGNHIDTGAGNVAAVGNTRQPLDAPPLLKTVIEPANIVVALQLLSGGYETATEAIKKRLEMK